MEKCVERLVDLGCFLWWIVRSVYSSMHMHLLPLVTDARALIYPVIHSTTLRNTLAYLRNVNPSACKRSKTSWTTLSLFSMGNPSFRAMLTDDNARLKLPGTWKYSTMTSLELLPLGLTALFQLTRCRFVGSSVAIVERNVELWNESGRAKRGWKRENIRRKSDVTVVQIAPQFNQALNDGTHTQHSMSFSILTAKSTLISFAWGANLYAVIWLVP